MIEVNRDIALDRISEDDIGDLVRYCNDPVIYRNTLHIPFPYSEEDARNFLEMNQKFEQLHRRKNSWAIRKDGNLVGVIGLLFEYGLDSHKSGLGYWIGKPFRKMGIMTAVLRHFSDYCFSSYNFVRLEAAVFPANKASMRVLEKAGFALEGLARCAIKKGDRYLDAYMYAKINPYEN